MRVHREEQIPSQLTGKRKMKKTRGETTDSRKITREREREKLGSVTQYTLNLASSN